MFGRRNPDYETPAATNDSDSALGLDILPELPDLPVLPTARDFATTNSNDDAPEQPHTASYGNAVRITPPETLPEPTPFVAPAPAASAHPNTPEPAAPAAPARSRASAESVIGPDDFFDGSYRSERGVRIQGSARGAIESRQYIFVEEGADVEASLVAEDITISGHFNGSIECRRRLEITETGAVHGTVTTALLVVHEGGLLDGELHMRRAEQPHSDPAE